MTLDLKTIHYVQGALIAAAGAAPMLIKAFPPGATPYLAASAAVCSFLGVILGTLSPSANPEVNARATVAYTARSKTQAESVKPEE